MPAVNPRLTVTVGEVVLERLQRQAEALGYPVSTYAGIVLSQASLQADRTMAVMQQSTSDAISRLLTDDEGASGA